jgi:hypothetical protein
MTGTSKFKKTLAREILLFFGVLVLTGLVWLFSFCRNYYYDNRTKSNQEKASAINLQIDSLPSDKLKALFEGTNKDFVSNYSVNNDKYIIPKKEEQEFLKDYPTAILLPISHKGYSYTHLDIFKKYGGHELFPKQLPPLPKGYSFQDSTTVFYFVALKTFRQLLKDNEYKDKFYKTFSQEYDLGTKLSFDSKIDTGLKFNDDVIKRQQKLLNEKQIAQNALNLSKGNIKSNDEILKFLLWTLIILGIIIYPIRLFFILLKWSFKTV